ncbi:MAG: type II toxin-antitoxin system VapC family toxin [Treponema sp.]|jgi:predicted nucleic acid-binding protein|nr:type II toxin-antitoxin system VapC family toxin [Treponema sp.]
MTYILDACALIALLDDEEGKDKVDELFTRAKAGEITLCMSIINMLEVYYGFIREDGLERAGEILAPIDETPLQIINLVSDPIYKRAARLKGAYDMSLADAVGLATAINLGGVFVTSDGEFKEPETREHAPVFWYRPPKPKK